MLTSVRKNQGFTLIELMVVVCIIGLLASVGISSFAKYIQMAKTVEAFEGLYKIRLGARQYFTLDQWDSKGHLIASQFPTLIKPTPLTGPCCDKCLTSNSIWHQRGWSSLMFMMNGPHYFQYKFEAQGVSVGSTYRAFAVGDLDCDTTYSTFELRGNIDSDGVPTAIGPIIINGLE